MRRCGPRAATSAGAARISAGLFVSLALAWAGCAAFAAGSAPYAPLPHPLVVEQVPGEPIYYTLGSPGVPNHDNEGNTSNAGFILTADGVVVFDALGTPSLGWNLLQAIRKKTHEPVRYNVVSHYHADHIYGLQAFKDHTSSLIVAQERATEYREDEETSGERAV